MRGHLFTRKPGGPSTVTAALLVLALTLGVALAFPSPAAAAPVNPEAPNIPAGWPWKINNLCYPTLGYPQIIKRGEQFTLEFDVKGRAAGGAQPDVTDWDVVLSSSNDTNPTLVNCTVVGAARAVSQRWFQGSLPQSATNGEWAGPWAGVEVWHVVARVPVNARPGLYDLVVTAEGATSVRDSQPHAVDVVAEYDPNFTFIQVSDFHINDPRGPSDIPAYPAPDQFKGYAYNSKAISDINLLNPDFVVMTGDLAFGFPWVANLFCPLLDPNDHVTDYTGSPPAWVGEYQKAYEQLLTLDVPVVCIPGNHDAYNMQTQIFGSQIKYTYGLEDGAHIWPTMVGPRYFGWNYGNLFHMTGIFSYDKLQRDTNPLIQTQRSFTDVVETLPLDGGAGWMRPNQKEWMIADLASSTAGFTSNVMVSHAPFYGTASWNTWDTQAIMDELMADARLYGVEFVLSGHTHLDDVWLDQTNPADPVTYINTTTTSFGTLEYPGFRYLSMANGKLASYNYKPGIYSIPTYKDTQVKIHEGFSQAYTALQHLSTPAIVGSFNSSDPSSTDKTFTCTNYLTDGSPPAVLSNTVADFEMSDLGDPRRYQVTGGTVLESWRPRPGNTVLRTRIDPVDPAQSVLTRARALYISSISPAQAFEGETIDVAITGTGTNFTQGVSQVAFSEGGITVNSVNVRDASHLTANITVADDAAPGVRDVSVATGSEIPFALQNGFTVIAETAFIMACDPTEVVQGHVVNLDVLGAFTHFGPESRATISGEGVTTETVEVSDPTHMTSKLTVAPDATVGQRNVNVVTGTEVPVPLADGLTVYAAPVYPPFVHTIDPAAAPVGTPVTLTGGNFGEARGSSTVTFNGMPVTNYVSWSDGRITCSVPYGASTGPVLVKTPWGESEPVQFEVLPYTFYFAEGTCRPEFAPFLSIQNPDEGTADVKITYMTGDGAVHETKMQVPPHSRSTVRVSSELGVGDDAAHDFSTKAECTNGEEIVVERPMYFDYQSQWTGGSDVVGATDPLPAQYFAEGTSRSGFDTYYCVQNPGAVDAQVKITYMKGDGTGAEQSFVVPAHARSTVLANEVIGEGDTAANDFSAKIECTNGQEIIAERPMYFNYDQVWPGGHDVIGARAPDMSFYFAEGTTRPDFDTYFCILNPGTATAAVGISYMKGDGTTAMQNVEVPAQTRVTVKANDFLGSGEDTSHDFSSRVTSTNGMPIVVERPMYFKYQGWCTGGSDVVGALEPSPQFYFAEGTTRPGFDTYFCIENPGLAHASVRVTYMRGDGAVVLKDMVVPALSRTTIRASDDLGVGNDAAHDFSTKIECTDGESIVAERPMYFLFNSAWPGGHDVIGFSP